MAIRMTQRWEYKRTDCPAGSESLVFAECEADGWEIINMLEDLAEWRLYKTSRRLNISLSDLLYVARMQRKIDALREKHGTATSDDKN